VSKDRRPLLIAKLQEQIEDPKVPEEQKPGLRQSLGKLQQIEAALHKRTRLASDEAISVKHSSVVPTGEAGPI
jgi:hypothetical protein